MCLVPCLCWEKALNHKGREGTRGKAFLFSWLIQKLYRKGR
jgi:hypothetical protein